MLSIDDRLLTEGAEPALIGARDLNTGRVLFPCPENAEQFEPIVLPRTGTLWSWTVQRFRPKSPPYKGPAQFEPYAIGYINLEDVVIIESRLVDVDFDKLKIGMPMELAISSIHYDGEDGARSMYAFRPAAGR